MFLNIAASLSLSVISGFFALVFASLLVAVDGVDEDDEEDGREEGEDKEDEEGVEELDRRLGCARM